MANCLKTQLRCQVEQPCNYHQGWHDGRTDQKEKSEHSDYHKGWIVGMIALEEAENGSPW